MNTTAGSGRNPQAGCSKERRLRANHHPHPCNVIEHMVTDLLLHLIAVRGFVASGGLLHGRRVGTGSRRFVRLH